MRLTELSHIGTVKQQYSRLRSGGCDRNAATGQMLELADTLSRREQLTFWVGLADGQFARKELSLETALCGLLALNRLAQEIPDITPGDLERRRKHYTQAPMPERKLGRPKKENP